MKKEWIASALIWSTVGVLAANIIPPLTAVAQTTTGGLGSLLVSQAQQQPQNALQNDLMITYRGNTGVAIISPVSTMQSGGPTPPSLSGTCTGLGTQVGGNTAGSFVATCTAQTTILTFAVPAPHGWVCQAWDQTTPADTMRQTSSNTTSCTLTGTTAASDVIVFEAVQY